MVDGPIIELGEIYPIINDKTLTNRVRFVTSEEPTFDTPLGVLSGINVKIVFIDDLRSLFVKHPETGGLVPPWVDFPLGEVVLHARSLGDRRTRIHRAPVGLTVVSFLPNDFKAEQLDFLQNQRAQLLLRSFTFNLDLYHSPQYVPEGINIRSGNIRNKAGEAREFLLPDIRGKLAKGHIRFLEKASPA